MEFWLRGGCSATAPLRGTGALDRPGLSDVPEGAKHVHQVFRGVGLRAATKRERHPRHVRAQGGGFGQIFGGQNRQNTSTQTGRDAQGRLVPVQNLSGQVSVIADQNTNSLIVVATPENADLIKGILGQLQFRPPTSLTGFSDTVGFDTISRIQEDGQTVASLVEAENMARDLNRPMRLAQLAFAFGILGSYDRAQDLARRAREILEQPMQSFFKVMGWGILAQYYVTIGDLDAAQTAFGNSQTNDVWLGAVTMSEYLLARGDYGEAARLSEREVAHRRQLGYIQPLPGLLYVQARSVRALGKTEQALELLTQARVAAEKISHRRLLWQIYSLLSEMERERGNIPEAERFQAKAREVLDFIVDHTPPELRASFLAQPAVHAIMGTQ